MPKLNYDVIQFHVSEAREQLQQIETELLAGGKPGESQLQVWFDHAFHHLNSAWNARRTTDRQFTNSTDEDFVRWGRLPRDINIAGLTARYPKSRKSKRAR